MPVSSDVEKRGNHPDPSSPHPRPVDPGLIGQPVLPAHDHVDAARRWQALFDAGLIPNRNPPAPPAVVARRAAADALFRGFARDRARLARECRQ